MDLTAEARKWLLENTQTSNFYTFSKFPRESLLLWRKKNDGLLKVLAWKALGFYLREGKEGSEILDLIVIVLQNTIRELSGRAAGWSCESMMPHRGKAYIKIGMIFFFNFSWFKLQEKMVHFEDTSLSGFPINIFICHIPSLVFYVNYNKKQPK